MTTPSIIVVAGPTATGKTAAALEIARAFNGELIAADSVQIVRGFDIGSATPTEKELDGVTHHLLSVLDPDAPADAAIFAGLADEAITDIQLRGRLPIVVGGTGLWVRALLRGLVELPPVDPDVRARILKEAEHLGRHALHARLALIDPLSASKIHPNDLLRVSRALEVFEQTGQPLGQLRAEHALGADRYRTLFLVLKRSEDHDIRLESRLEEMLKLGWVEETKELLEQWERSCRAFGSVGYAQLVKYLDGQMSFEDTKEAIRVATRTYSKRQRTWFRGEPGVSLETNFDSLNSPNGQKIVRRFLDGEDVSTNGYTVSNSDTAS